MKTPISIKFLFSSAILAWALMGEHAVQSSNAQPQPAPQPNTDLISSFPDNAPTAGALPPDIDPNSPLAQVVQLVQAGVEQSVILSYIGNSMNPFDLTADQIIYLNDLGVPSEIINAMQQRDQQLQQMGAVANAPPTQTPAPTETTAAAPAEVTVNYFYDTLAPYGGWLNVAGYGWCWRPTIVVYHTGWQPYCDNGHWVYTDCGWYWVSGYSWGWAAFHYGRWFQIPHYGWCWWPDTTWSPSWVCWRHDRDYCGWAPLPPHAVYQAGVGFVYQGHAVSAGFNFGLGANDFTFVSTRDFCDPHPRRHRVEAGEVTRIFNQTTVINNISFDSHHQGVVNAGIPPQDIAAVTRQEIHPVTIQAGNGSVAWGGRHEQFAYHGNTLVVNRPRFVGTPVLSLHQGTPPRVPQAQQPVAPHINTPNLSAPNNAAPTPPRNYPTWPNQNQKPNYNYNNSGNPVLTPRTQDSEQPSSSDPATANHYFPSVGQQQNNSAPPPDESRYHNQNSYRSDPHFQSSRQVVQPYSSSQSSSASSQSSGKQGQNQNNGQGGH
jgi:hypothetical protein